MQAGQNGAQGRHWRLQETSAGGMEHRAGQNGAQALPASALYWAGRNAYPT